MQRDKLYYVSLILIFITISTSVFAQGNPPVETRIRSIAWSPDSTKLAYTTNSGSTKVVNALTNQVLFTFQSNSTGATASIVWSPDGTKLATGGVDEVVHIWNSTNGSLLNTLAQMPYADIITALAWSSDGSKLVQASYSGNITIWNTTTYQIQRSIVSPASILSISLNPDGSKLATSGGVAINVWNTNTGQRISIFLKHTAEVISVAWSPNSDIVASAGLNNTIYSWNGFTGQIVQTFTGHTDAVVKVSWNPDGTRLASASQDHTVRVWNASTGQLQNTIIASTPVQAIAWSPDGNKLAYGGDNIAIVIVPAPGVVVSCFVDDTVANFSLGSNSSTLVSDLNGGAVILNPAMAQNFNGTSLPSGWTSSNWQTGGSVTVSGGSLQANKAIAGTTASYAYTTALDFGATIPAAVGQQIGYSSNLSLNTTYAVFGTQNTTNNLYAQTSNGTNTLIPGNWLGAPHRFRIQRSLTNFVFSIDGNVVATHNYTTATSMRIVASSNSSDASVLTVDWLQVSPYTTPGTYTSRVYDAGANQNWDAVTWTASGITVSISARTGNTAAPDGTWTVYTTIASPGTSLGRASQYIQYQAVLSTGNTNQTPALEQISFNCTPVP